VLYISSDSIHSFIASTNHNSGQSYFDNFWEGVKRDTPEFSDMVAEYLRENIDGDESRTFFLEGMWITYEIIRRQIEANEMNRAAS